MRGFLFLTLLLHSCSPKAIRALVVQKSTTRKLNHQGMDLATDEHKETRLDTRIKIINNTIINTHSFSIRVRRRRFVP